MADANTNTAEKTRKTRKAQGPRKPQPLYAFVTVTDGKVALQKATKDAKEVAQWYANGGVNGDTQLLVIDPAIADKPAPTTETV